MSKALITRNNIPYFDRDEFLTPFDRVFDQLFETNFPEFVRSVGVKPYQGSAYPKVNVYEYDEKVGIVAEIPGLTKKDISVEVEDGTLTISGGALLGFIHGKKIESDTIEYVISPNDWQINLRDISN